MTGTQRQRLERSLLRLGALALVLSGCALLPPERYAYLDVAHPRVAATITDPRCPRDGAGLGAGDMRAGAGPAPGAAPTGFSPTRVRLCRLHGDAVQVSGALRYAVDEETSEAAPGFLQTLTLPDQEFDPRDHAACSANYTPPVFLLLLDHAGRSIRALLPSDPCGHPRADVQAAIDDLRPTTVTTYTFDQSPA